MAELMFGGLKMEELIDKVGDNLDELEAFVLDHLVTDKAKCETLSLKPGALSMLRKHFSRAAAAGTGTILQCI